MRTPHGVLPVVVGSVLAVTGDCVALVDLGLGAPALEPSELLRAAHLGTGVGGRLIDNLGAAGIGCRDVDVVLFTGLLPHQLGWLEIAGEATFPNAVYQASTECWRRAGQASVAGSMLAPTVAQAAELGRRLVTLPAGPTVVPGLTAQGEPDATGGELRYATAEGTTVSGVAGALTPRIVQARTLAGSSTGQRDR